MELPHKLHQPWHAIDLTLGGFCPDNFHVECVHYVGCDKADQPVLPYMAIQGTLYDITYGVMLLAWLSACKYNVRLHTRNKWCSVLPYMVG